MITYESVCAKLGFRLEDYKIPKPSDPWLTDDSYVSPFHVLNDQESEFIWNYMLEHPEVTAHAVLKK